MRRYHVYCLLHWLPLKTLAMNQPSLHRPLLLLWSLCSYRLEANVVVVVVAAAVAVVVDLGVNRSLSTFSLSQSNLRYFQSICLLLSHPD